MIIIFEYTPVRFSFGFITDKFIFDTHKSNPHIWIKIRSIQSQNASANHTEFLTSVMANHTEFLTSATANHIEFLISATVNHT